MSYSSQHPRETSHWSSPKSAAFDEIAQFREALDAIVAQQSNDAECALNALIDFFACRCRNNQQLQALGVGLFAALNNQTAVTTKVGVYDEQFGFHRDQDIVRIDVDRQQLAAMPLDVAVRLATLLRGASRSNIGRSHAA